MPLKEDLVSRRYMLSVLPMHNPIQEYAWGSQEMLARFLGQEIPSPVPQAELWMGAHPNAPSLVQVRGEWQRLDLLIQEAPSMMLGTRNKEQFGPHLPFLFKVLAVARPLSLQVHPNAKQAGAGFQKEEALAVPPGAVQRIYKDPNPKPECICALEPFWGLNGFRPCPEIGEWFSQLTSQGLQPEIDILCREQSSDGLQEMLSSLLSMDMKRRENILDSLRDQAQAFTELDRSDPRYWLAALIEEYPEDIGVLAPFFLQIMHLSPGQAAFLPPGRLHAYLHGLGLEIMANSDNVLRAGLTPKHVDVRELLHTLDFDHQNMELLKPLPREGGGFVYPVRTDEFSLSGFDLEDDVPQSVTYAGDVHILLCTGGEVQITVEETGECVVVQQGQSMCIPGCIEQWSVSGQGRGFVARTGVESASYQRIRENR
jgi:mannose-6-phosphate isomerase